MKNAYDIRHEKNLIYILPLEVEAIQKSVNKESRSKAAVILYLYYLETLPVYWSYIDGIAADMDLYIISSREDVLAAVQEHINQSCRKRVRYILKENRGRDVSALLVTSAGIVRRYEYICFLHDKKEHSAEVKKDTDLWIENLWGNLLGSTGYIDRILQLFDQNPMLGVLAPPEPVGDHFCTWYGYGWHRSFDITKKLAEQLQLDTDLTAEKPPLTIGTALWFKREALQKLFDAGWRYEDFDDEGLKSQDYLSYGIERIFPYVAQDAGFETGTVMTAAYAEKQMNYIQYSASILFSEAKHFFPVSCISDLKRYRRSREMILHFARQRENLYLYGAGEMGRFCLSLLREANIFPCGFLVSKADGGGMVCGLPVHSIQDIEHIQECAVIITVFEEKARKEMIRNLKDRGIHDYRVFWGDGE